jgi:apolipoprotein N-acyltransferase
LNKIRHYINTLTLIKGFFISILLSSFIYLDYFELSYPILDTTLAIAGLYLVLVSERYTYFSIGFFTSLLWFWWIGISFLHYHMAYLIPFVLLLIGLIYGFLFYLIAKISTYFSNNIYSLLFKAFGLFTLSYIHPFGFDWLKPELIFINSYFGIQKWQFGIVLLSLVLSIYKKNIVFLLPMILAYTPNHPHILNQAKDIKLTSTHISVEDKWNPQKLTQNNTKMLKLIDEAITKKYKTIILPESVFVSFLNYDKELFDRLKAKAKDINIVAGGLYLDGNIPRNSTYIFTKTKVQVAHKYVLVPFGESNPLPKFLSDWVNEVFYDGAVDYVATNHPSTYTIDDTNYTNAICYEATSSKLYKHHPKNIIAMSNNGWFTPSIEPTLQKLLLKYYSQKYHTTIYHSANMSKAYLIKMNN